VKQASFSMQRRPYADLLLICIFSLLLIPIILLSVWMPLRIILGLPFILLFPGYSLLAALFPAKNSLSNVERLTYSIALSVALTGLIGLLLNYVWYIGLYPMLISLLSVIIITSSISRYRRRRLPFFDRPGFSIKFRWKRWPGIDITLTSVLIVVILGAAAVAGRTYINNKKGYTEFYLLGSGGKAAGYPESLSVGNTGEVTLVLANHERTAARYLIETIVKNGRVWLDGEERTDLDLNLEDKQQSSFNVKFAFDSPGSAQKLDFLLYKDEGAQSYLELYLKVDVSP
jgi:uncharacterized membrane protein